MLKDLKELLDDHQTGMSEFQDDYFVTARAGGTLYGQYKQSLREVYKRFRGLRETLCDREKLQIETEQQKHISESCKDEFEARLAEVEYKRKSLQMEETERLLKDTKREFLRFYSQASYLKKQIGPMDDKKRAELDRDMWVFKLKEMAAIDFVTQGRLGRSTYEFVNSVPKEIRDKALPEIRDHQNLLTWYETKDEFHIPDELPQVEFNFESVTLIEEKI